MCKISYFKNHVETQEPPQFIKSLHPKHHVFFFLDFRNSPGLNILKNYINKKNYEKKKIKMIASQKSNDPLSNVKKKSNE